MLCDLCPIADFFHHQMGKDKTMSHQRKNRGATEVKLCTVLVVSMMDITVKSKVKWSNYNNGSAIQGWRIKRWERYLGWKGARANLCFFFCYLHSWQEDELQLALEIGHCVEWLMTTTPEVPENRGKRTHFSWSLIRIWWTERGEERQLRGQLSEMSKRAGKQALCCG